MAKKTEYKGKEIPEHILEMPQSKTRSKKMSAFKDWVDVGIEMETHPYRYYTAINPETGEVHSLDLADAKIQIYNKLGGYKNHLNKYDYPLWMPDEQKKEIEKHSSKLFGMKLHRGRKKSIWQSQRKKLDDPTSLLNGQRDFVINEMARGKTLEEVNLEVNEKFNLEIDKRHIRKFRAENINLIDKEREAIESGKKITPLIEAHGRIKRLSYLYNTNEQKYEEQDYPIPRANIMLKIMEQIRKEVEGDKIVLDINGKIDVDLTMNINHTFKNLMKQMPLMSFIVALVAAKKNINPMRMMSLLQRSIYSKYSGVGGVLQEGEQQDLSILPSNKVYDWLQLKHRKQVDLGTIDIEEQNEAEKKKVSDVRERLLGLIEDKTDKTS